ncbi:MAG: hypothetical protein Q8M56_10940, partial [Desulfobacterales bacterium]|nr:hypothetical protein [Desulfobacterales bacterium]
RTGSDSMEGREITMERRDFLKTGILTICSLYGFSENIASFAGDKNLPAHQAGTGHYPFTGVYSGTVTNERVMMPDMFSRLLVQRRFSLIVPERNSSALLISENSPEWEILKPLFDEADNKDAPLVLRESSEIDGEGNLYFPEKVSEFAGIRTPAVTIIGHGYVIEIIDSERYHSRIETFEERPILAKYKEGDNFNHRNTLSISRIGI